MSGKLLLFSLFAVFAVAEYRTHDGSNNNLANPDWGKSNTKQLRTSALNSYSDPGHGVLGSSLNEISSRDISNIVFDRDSVETDIGASELLSYWGQFLDHDIVLTPAGADESLYIPISECDKWFDPNCTVPTAQRNMRITRSLFDNSTGVRTQFNLNTAFMDASMVYGSDDDRASVLRLYVGGKMNVSASGLPYNSIGYAMDNNARKFSLTDLFLGGDVRANENPALTSLHVVFLREHNRWCDVFAQNHTDWDDEKLYQEARRMVIGILQHINMNEYLPAILGKSLPEYTGYNASVNPGIDIIFSSAGFRYGHSEISTQITRVKEDRTPADEGNIPLRDGYFDPTWITNNGVDDIIRGISYAPQQRVDVAVVDDLRNFLFGKPGQGGLDLVAVNIMRGRDHGIPDYNTVREIMGLPRVTTFEQITTDRTISNALQQAYVSVDNIDTYVGGLAEDSTPPANVGPLFSAIYMDQTIRLRDGDRFWFENPDAYSASEISMIQATTLTDVILRTTNIQKMPCFPFFTTPILDCPLQPGQNTSGGTTLFRVQVVAKTPESPVYGLGNSFGYSLNNVQTPELTLTRGVNYTFLTSQSCLHPFYITTSDLGNGLSPLTPSGCGGDVVTFMPTADTPDLIYYQCMLHINLGWKINIVDAPTTTAPIPVDESTNTHTISIMSVLLLALLVCIW